MEKSQLRSVEILGKGSLQGSTTTELNHFLNIADEEGKDTFGEMKDPRYPIKVDQSSDYLHLQRAGFP